MKLFQTTALVAALAIAATPTLADGKSFSEMTVKVDLSDFEDSNALEFYPDLEADVGKAIAEKIELTADMEDPRVDVKIKKVAVDGDTVLPDSMEFNQLEGFVAVYDGKNAVDKGEAETVGPIATKDIRLIAKTPEVDFPEEWIVIPPSQTDFYDALVTAFADHAVEFIEGVN